MHTFTYTLPTRVIFGPGAIDSVGEHAVMLGTHGLLVTGRTFAQRSGLVERIRASLQSQGVATTVYDNVGQNPGVKTIDDGGRAARDSHVNFVMGLGGGSAMDAAKAIAAAARATSSIWDYTSAMSEPRQTVLDALPVLQVPIVASTGSETNDIASILSGDSGVKAWLQSPHLLARVAIVDPALTFTVPPRYTAVGGMNIVSRMLETYLTGDEFPPTDRITEGLMRVVMDSLPRAMKRGEDLDARTNLSWVATFSSGLIPTPRHHYMPVQDMAQALCARYTVEYGFALAALWPSYMRYALINRQRLPQIGRFKRYALLGRQIFGVHETDDEVAAETTMYRLSHWLQNMDMPTGLHALGIHAESFAELASQAIALSGAGDRLTGGLSTEDVENIYEGALQRRS